MPACAPRPGQTLTTRADRVQSAGSGGSARQPGLPRSHARTTDRRLPSLSRSGARRDDRYGGDDRSHAHRGNGANESAPVDRSLPRAVGHAHQPACHDQAQEVPGRRGSACWTGDCRYRQRQGAVAPRHWQAGYGPTQPTGPPAWMKISPARGASDVWNNSPPGGGFTQIQQLFTVFGGSRKVTFSVTPAGTTLGVTDPHSGPMAFSPSSARNSVTGSGLLLTTVTVQGRAPVGMGPAAGGNGVGIGVGVGKTGGAGLGKAGNVGGDTPRGTYSSAEPVATHTPSRQSRPPATRTVPSSSRIAGVPCDRSMGAVVLQDRVSGSYRSATVDPGVAGKNPLKGTSTMPSDNSVAGR